MSTAAMARSGATSAALADVLAKASGSVVPASRLAERDADHATRPVLPVRADLAAVLPAGGLRLGSVVTVQGSLSTALCLLGPTTQRGGWAAVVGVADLGALAASELGVRLDRLALVPRPGTYGVDVVAALLDGVAIVAAAASALPAGQAGLVAARRLSARARERNAVLVGIGEWPVADLRLRCSDTRWSGLDRGFGHIRGHETTVTMNGRGAATLEVSARIQFPVQESATTLRAERRRPSATRRLRHKSPSLPS